MSSTAPSKTALWLGWFLSVLAALPFVMSAGMKFSGSDTVVQGMGHFGWNAPMIPVLAILEAGSVLLYLAPPVAVLGGIVLTGYLGGAIATHLRIGEAVWMHLVIGLFIWGGLYLRHPRLRELIPYRRA